MPPVSPNDLTRQQLDELDTLLQRMLHLPVSGASPGKETTSATGAERKSPIPLPDPPARVETPTAPRSYSSRVPEITWEPNPVTRSDAETPVSMPPTLRGVDAPALPHDFRVEKYETPDEPLVPMTVVQPSSQRIAASDETKQPRYFVPIWAWPIFGVNWLIEALLGLFGPIGSTVTHPIMKNVLSVVGILMLIAAALWSARGMGWIDPIWLR